MEYKVLPLTKELFNELRIRNLIWKNYKLQYKSVAVFPPNGEKPLVVTEAVWKNYFKPLWDKGYFTFSYSQAIASCENVDERWAEEYRTYDHLNEVYEDKECDKQKHTKFNTYWVSTQRKTWTRNERAEFRNTTKWIMFSDMMKSKHGFRCDDCGRLFNEDDLEVHHLIEDEDYDNLDPSRFKVLCLECHDKIHNLDKYQDEIRKVKPIVPIKKVKKVKKIKPIKTIKKVKKIKKIVSE